MTELLPCEEWKAIPGFEGFYEVSNLGRVRSWYVGGGYRLAEPRLKKIQLDKDGYPFVLLYKHRELQCFRVSRLVLYAFVGMPEKLMEASHVDGNKKNNQVSNLRWETRQENEDRKWQHGTRPFGEGNPASKVTEEQVREIRALRLAGHKLQSLANQYGISQSNVSAICKGRIWSHVE